MVERGEARDAGGARPLRASRFESPSHADALLGGLNALRIGGHLLDVTLYAQGHAFRAHRAVLASCSDYFRAMFTDAMLESTLSEIRLEGVTAEGMRLLLDYAYTSKLALDLANVQDALSAASHVQVVAVVEACSNYLHAQLDRDNCVDVATIAETYSLTALRRRVYRFISGRLREFSESSEFYRLAPQQLEYLLACDFPVDCPETEVLRIVLRWLRHREDRLGYEQRVACAARLLSRVRFSEMSDREIESVLRESFAGPSRRDGQLYRRALWDARRRTNPGARAVPVSESGALVNSRGMELAIVKIGGFGIGGITNEITYYLPSEGKWKCLTSIPHVEQCNFGAVVRDNELFVVGGCFDQSLQENIHPFGFRYDPRSNKWTTMSPMRRERCRFSLVAVGDHIYAIGGESEVEGESGEEESACERYDPASDSWRGISPLPSARSQHAGCALPSGSRLLVSGGLRCDRVLSSVRCYDATADRWTPRAPLLTPRADHAMLAIGERVYACGGWYEDPETGNRILAETIDVYDASSDSWEVVTRVPTPRYHAGIVAVENKIYLIGGFHSDAMFDRATAAIECYDIETDFWITGDSYPQDVWEHACATLYVPKCRDDMDVLTDSKQKCTY